MEKKNVEIFNHEVFGNLEVVIYQEKPTFYANDVADLLGYSRSEDGRKHCKSLIKLNFGATAKLNLKSNGNHGTYLMGESDLYRMIMKSGLPYAEKFQDWVVEEVLPSIRKHGGYLSGQESMTPEELMAKAVLMAQSKIDELNGAVERKTELISDKNFPISLSKMFSGNNRIAQAANIWMEDQGWIKKTFEKGKKMGWNLTEEGEKLGYGCQHSKHSIFWVPKILELLPTQKALNELAVSMDLKNWRNQ